MAGELSSLLGGVLKGDTLASTEGRRSSGSRVAGGGMAIVTGFAGIFGLSARLTGGGALTGCLTAFMVSESSPPSFETASPGSTGSTLGRRGLGGLLEDLLECWEMSSRTFPKGVLSIRSGDREELRSKKVRGGDLGESTLTEGVN